MSLVSSRSTAVAEVKLKPVKASVVAEPPEGVTVTV